MHFKALFRRPGDRLTKTFCIMKLMAVFILAACLQVQARSYGQLITLSEKGASLEKIFRSIYQQTGYQFLYNDETLQDTRKIDISVKNASLAEVLELCSRDQPLEYIIRDRVIVVKPKTARAPAIPEDTAHLPPIPGIHVKGLVFNETGQFLSGATVSVKGKSKGAITNTKGEFELPELPLNSMVVVSYIGYNTRQLEVRDGGYLMVGLTAAVSELDKSVVQAYGMTSRRLATGNIAKVTAEEIEKQPVMNPLLALQGRVAGLVITPNSGYASGTAKVEIRGRSTINASFTSDPLYIIDGVPLTVLETGGNSNYQYGSTGFVQNGLPAVTGGQSPFFSLNPADIESMEVLKDADATAIYGSRGANGVILITTKKGKAGKSGFSLNATQGISKVTRHWNMLNTTQYLQMRREAFRNDGITPTIANAPDLLLWDTTRNEDWQKSLWGGTGRVTDVQAGLTGGDGRTVFRIGADYRRQTEILTQSGANQRATLSFNLTHHTLNQKLSVSLTANYSYAGVNTISTPSAATLPPDAPPIYNKTGGLNYAPWDAAGIGYQYPFAPLLSPYTTKTNFLTSNLSLNYELVKGLTLAASMGYNNTDLGQSLLSPITSQDPISSPAGTAFFGTNKISNWIIEPQIDYTLFIGEGKLNVLAGASTQASMTDGALQYGLGYTNDAFIRTISGASMIIANEQYAQYKYAAVFGRINYDWANKYILNLNVRRDGSSRFGPGRQFGNFGSAGFAWIATEEKWLRRALPAVFSFVKLRGSYGLTGSDAVGEYQYLSQWANSELGNYTPLYTYGGISPLVNEHAVNQDYHWQVNKKGELALDLGFLKDNRINVEAAYYRNRCNNQLLQYPTPVFSGFPSVTANWPATIQNDGWEFLLDAKLLQVKNFSWSVKANLSFNRNTLLAYPNIGNSPYATTYKVGQPINNRYLLHYTGIDPQTGQYGFADANHDGSIMSDNSVIPGTQDDDRSVAINLDPKFFGGFGNQFNYKEFALSFFFSFKKQKAQNAYYTGVVPGGFGNLSVDIFKDRWQQPGDKACYARFTTQGTTSDYNFQTSDRAYTDASYIRLSTLSFSYNLPAGLANKAGMQRCSLFINAQNIFVITGYKGIDPEIQSFGAMPPAKIFTGGISFNF